jgi:hypothetical protein
VSIFLLSVILTGLLLFWLCALSSAIPVLDFLSRANFHFCHLVSTPFRLIRDFYNLIPAPFARSDSSKNSPVPVTFDRPIALVERKISDISHLIAQLNNIAKSQQQLLEELNQLSDDFDALLANDLRAELADPQRIPALHSEAHIAAVFNQLVSDFYAEHSATREIVMKETRAEAGHFSFKSSGFAQPFHVPKITFGPAAAAMTIRIGLRLKGKEVFVPGDRMLSATSGTEVQINLPQMFDEVQMEIVEGDKAAAIQDFKMFEPLRLIV